MWAQSRLNIESQLVLAQTLTKNMNLSSINLLHVDNVVFDESYEADLTLSNYIMTVYVDNNLDTP